MPTRSEPLGVDALRSKVRTAGGALRLLYDTNVVRSLDWLLARQTQTNLWNELVANGAVGRTLSVHMSAIAYAELLRYYRCRFGDSFDPSFFDDPIRNGVFELEAFAQPHAEALAAALAKAYPKDKDWQRAKAERVWQWVGGGAPLAAKTPRCSATVDWWIAGQALGEDRIVVTDDKGPEWSTLPGLAYCDAATLEHTLDALLSEHPTP